MSINKALEIIEANQGEADFIGEIDEYTIIDAENKLNVKFPKSYRLFLKKYGLGDIFGEEIYGLGTDETGIPNMIWITKELRKTENLPNSLICFYFADDGKYFCLDCSKVHSKNDDNAPVVSYISGLPIKEQPFEMIAENFGDFLSELLMDSLED
ncbi:SUKH superfamily protein [Cytobacillus oceanisediminis]|uniref:SUKH superfamily protein n=1 Tax=Cytobacillus oceanisediminis TaxID=665099 RepID=A0A2V2ZKQ5_9BACI|nr:SMI1/KNR4 family protein [Cytobacillus oceanisediminis]PWW17441.1 SUKH superfamily protein [Cytobacillus oceanisediminis]